MEQIKAFLASFYQLDGAGRVVLAPSGTDCALAATALMGMTSARLTTLLPGVEETGSGVPLATCGRHFASRTARGQAVHKGTLLEALPPMRSMSPCRCVAVVGHGYLMMRCLRTAHTRLPVPCRMGGVFCCMCCMSPKPGSLSCLPAKCRLCVRCTRQGWMCWWMPASPACAPNPCASMCSGGGRLW